MREYTEGVCDDGAAILRDGAMLTIEQVLETLNGQRERIETLTAERDEARGLAEAELSDSMKFTLEAKARIESMTKALLKARSSIESGFGTVAAIAAIDAALKG